MTDLTTSFLDFRLPNPFILGPGPCTSTWQTALEALKAGWGGIVLSTICSSPPPLPQMQEQVIRAGYTRWGVIGAEPISDQPPETWIDGISQIRAAFPSSLLFASIYGGADPEAWQVLAKQLTGVGVSGFELNACLANPFGQPSADNDLGKDPDALARIIGWIREASSLPILVKLSPNVTDILPAARAALKAGANAFIATGSLTAIGGIDTKNMPPQPNRGVQGLLGRYHGPGLKPVALRWTATIAKSLGSPLIGAGGITTWQDAVEFFAVGATAALIGIGATWQGIEMIADLKTGLAHYLKEHGFPTLSEIRGRALPNIVGFDQLDLDYKLVAAVDEELCNGCEVCVRACRDGGFQAITMSEGLAIIHASKCDGCGLCACVCPTNAIRMRDRQSGQQAPS